MIDNNLIGGNDEPHIPDDYTHVITVFFDYEETLYYVRPHQNIETITNTLSRAGNILDVSPRHVHDVKIGMTKFLREHNIPQVDAERIIRAAVDAAKKL
jgi:hypothetical protein